MVCMYACVHIGVHCWQDGVSLRGSNTDRNPSYGCVGWKPLVWVCHVLYCFPIETRETSRTGLPFVGVYTFMYLRMHIHGCICMRVCSALPEEQDWSSRAEDVALSLDAIKRCFTNMLVALDRDTPQTKQGPALPTNSPTQEPRIYQEPP